MTVPSGGGRARLLVWILACSLALNLFFVAGIAWTRLASDGTRRPPVMAYQEFARGLNLNATQQASFEHFVTALRERGRQEREVVKPLDATLWALLADPAPDQARLAVLLNERLESRGAAQREVSFAFAAFLATLDPKQHASTLDFARRLQENAPRHWWGGGAGH
ncbi:MAG TPA: periplasmic heavy metal sensor [Stellaceae bacterium]|nr:periplasmic heavy metal sensor [Stellaceae bacterium]